MQPWNGSQSKEEQSPEPQDSRTEASEGLAARQVLGPGLQLFLSNMWLVSKVCLWD